jgi:hypothetical protein
MAAALRGWSQGRMQSILGLTLDLTQVWFCLVSVKEQVVRRMWINPAIANPAIASADVSDASDTHCLFAMSLSSMNISSSTTTTGIVVSSIWSTDCHGAPAPAPSAEAPAGQVLTTSDTEEETSACWSSDAT